jgi:hypothetical protein
VSIQFPSSISWKDFRSFIEFFSLPLSEVNRPYMEGVWQLFYSIGLHICHHTNNILFWLLNIAEGFEIRNCKPFNLAAFFLVVLALKCPLRFHINFMIRFSILVNIVGILVEIAIVSVALDIVILTTLSL